MLKYAGLFYLIILKLNIQYFNWWDMGYQIEVVAPNLIMVSDANLSPISPWDQKHAYPQNGRLEDETQID